MDNMIFLCDNCINAIKSRGEKVLVGDFHSVEEEITCEWCKEIEDVYECYFI